MINLYDTADFPGVTLDQAAIFTESVNKKLNAYLQCQERVYGDIRLGSYHGKPILWSVDQKDDSTHSAVVVMIEKTTRGT